MGVLERRIRISGIKQEGDGKNMNKVILMGRLTRDPEIRWTQGQDQMCIARFTLAVDRRQRRQDGQQAADFPSCTAFGKAQNSAKST